MIVKKPDGYYVVSESRDMPDKGRRNLGGPYKTRAEALKRLAQVEHYKTMSKKPKGRDK